MLNLDPVTEAVVQAVVPTNAIKVCAASENDPRDPGEGDYTDKLRTDNQQMSAKVDLHLGLTETLAET